MTHRVTADLQAAIETKNEDKIRELVKKVQDLARDVLTGVYKKFLASLQA
jgi:hypothetical protein